MVHPTLLGTATSIAALCARLEARALNAVNLLLFILLHITRRVMVVQSAENQTILPELPAINASLEQSLPTADWVQMTVRSMLPLSIA